MRSNSLLTSLGNYALVGTSAAGLLSVVELIDLNIRLAPGFHSVAERAIFGAYFSLNLVSGLVIGLSFGLFVHITSLLQRTAQSAIARGKSIGLTHRVASILGVSAIAAFLLNQQPHIHGHLIEMIREAEKFESLRATLLRHELLVSYATLMIVVVCCSVLSKIIHHLRSSRS